MIFYFLATVYFSYCKEERKQFGLPKFFFLSRQFWKPDLKENGDKMLFIMGLQKSFGNKIVLNDFGL